MDFRIEYLRKVIMENQEVGQELFNLNLPNLPMSPPSEPVKPKKKRGKKK